MKKCLLLLWICMYASSAFSQTNAVIKTVLEDMKAFNKQESTGDEDNSPYPFGKNREEDFLRRYQFYKKESDKLNSINEKDLSFDDQINIALLKYTVNDELISYEYKEYLNPILADAGFHTGLPGMGSRNYSTKKELERYINSLKGIRLFVDENLALM